MPPVVETHKLSKAYGEVVAVRNLDLQVDEGEVFGLLGPNGAGKTTTILMLLGLTEPTAGTAWVCGFDSTRQPLQVKRLAGYLPERVGFYEDLTARENLSYTARLIGLLPRQTGGRIGEVLETVGLTQRADTQVGKFSRGMKQRLGIADVLLKRPRVAFLDEPTVGIDPDGVNRTLELIVKMSREERMTVLLSSHLLHQVQQICHRVGIFVRGQMVAQGPVERLGQLALKEEEVRIEVLASPLSPALTEALKRLPGVRRVEEREMGRLLLGCAQDLRPQVAQAVIESGSHLVELRAVDYALEEIYLKYFREA